MSKRFGLAICALLALFVSLVTPAQAPPGEGPALGDDRITQAQIESGEMSLDEIRIEGLRMFTTPFNKLDGYGDGPMDPADSLMPGGRPTLQGNGTLLRVNGLDARTCLECHAQVSAATFPPTLGIGGVGGSNANAIILPTTILMDPPNLDGSIEFNGRFANPPFLFGAGAVELLAAEMTTDLQAAKAVAIDNPGTVVPLESKGVSFGSIVADIAGDVDTTNVVGVKDDLVVRPFGRKGDNFSVRDFDIAAMMFHFGMQPAEAVGDGVDADGDGVSDEILRGELSTLSVFAATLERPLVDRMDSEAFDGFQRFQDVGCASCHVPTLQTRSKRVALRLPEVPTDPSANVFMEVDLTRAPVSFPENGDGGISVNLFSDLKRHDMGAGLAEDFGLATEKENLEFVTARLWGIADTAPYLHDGRATTLTEAILAHGGEAQSARDNFENLVAEDREELLHFLRHLRTPSDPVRDLIELIQQDDDEDEDDDDEDHDGKHHSPPPNDEKMSDDLVSDERYVGARID